MNATRLFTIFVVTVQMFGCNTDNNDQSGGEHVPVATDLTPSQQKQLEDYRNRKVEFRLANSPESIEANTGQLLLTETNVLTGRDILSMHLAKNTNDKPCINITAVRGAESRMLKLTGENVGKFIVVLVNGKQVHEFEIRAPFGRYSEISGRMTESELETLMHKMEGRGI